MIYTLLDGTIHCQILPSSEVKSLSLIVLGHNQILDSNEVKESYPEL